MLKVVRDRANLVQSLHDTRSVVRSLELIIGVGIHIVFFFLYLLIFQVGSVNPMLCVASPSSSSSTSSSSRWHPSRSSNLCCMSCHCHPSLFLCLLIVDLSSHTVLLLLLPHASIHPRWT